MSKNHSFQFPDFRALGLSPILLEKETLSYQPVSALSPSQVVITPPNNRLGLQSDSGFLITQHASQRMFRNKQYTNQMIPSRKAWISLITQPGKGSVGCWSSFIPQQALNQHMLPGTRAAPGGISGNHIWLLPAEARGTAHTLQCEGCTPTKDDLV